MMPSAATQEKMAVTLQLFRNSKGDESYLEKLAESSIVTAGIVFVNGLTAKQLKSMGMTDEARELYALAVGSCIAYATIMGPEDPHHSYIVALGLLKKAEEKGLQIPVDSKKLARAQRAHQGVKSETVYNC